MALFLRNFNQLLLLGLTVLFLPLFRTSSGPQQSLPVVIASKITRRRYFAGGEATVSLFYVYGLFFLYKRM